LDLQEFYMLQAPQLGNTTAAKGIRLAKRFISLFVVLGAEWLVLAIVFNFKNWYNLVTILVSMFILLLPTTRIKGYTSVSLLSWIVTLWENRRKVLISDHLAEKRRYIEPEELSRAFEEAYTSDGYQSKLNATAEVFDNQYQMLIPFKNINDGNKEELLG